MEFRLNNTLAWHFGNCWEVMIFAFETLVFFLPEIREPGSTATLRLVPAELYVINTQSPGTVWPSSMLPELMSQWFLTYSACIVFPLLQQWTSTFSWTYRSSPFMRDNWSQAIQFIPPYFWTELHKVCYYILLAW